MAGEQPLEMHGQHPTAALLLALFPSSGKYLQTSVDEGGSLANIRGNVAGRILCPLTICAELV